MLASMPAIRLLELLLQQYRQDQLRKRGLPGDGFRFLDGEMEELRGVFEQGRELNGNPCSSGAGSSLITRFDDEFFFIMASPVYVRDALLPMELKE
jgi:hypothetical protein